MTAKSGMSSSQGIAVILLLLFIAVWTYVGFVVSIPDRVHHDEHNLVKIECFLHRDDADVHRLCVDQGYDR